MEIGQLVEIHKKIKDLEPDIAERQGKNREKVFSIYAGNTFGEDEGELKQLLFHKMHYFDEGYFVPMTPEELDKAIKDETERLIKVKKEVLKG